MIEMDILSMPSSCYTQCVHLHVDSCFSIYNGPVQELKRFYYSFLVL